MSEIFKNTCKLLKIEKIKTTAYHLESNGALERSHRTLAEYLRHYINADQTDWDEWTPYAMFTYNTTPHTSTGYTPFELVYGNQASLPTALTKPPRATYSYDDYAQELRERIRATNQIVRDRVKEEKQKSKEYYDKTAKETLTKRHDANHHYEIDEFNDHPGIHFEKIGQLHYSQKAWKLVIKLDLTKTNQ
ncbi:enzymatic polyprotein endonuclease reverse, partial [Lasius niger]